MCYCSRSGQNANSMTENIASLSIPETGTVRLFGKWEYVQTIALDFANHAALRMSRSRTFP